MENVSYASWLFQSGLEKLSEAPPGSWGGCGNDVFLGCLVFFVLLVSVAGFLCLHCDSLPGNVHPIKSKAQGMPPSRLMPGKIGPQDKAPDAVPQTAQLGTKNGPKEAPQTTGGMLRKTAVTVDGKPFYSGQLYYKGFMVAPGTPQSVIDKYEKEAASIMEKQPYKKDLALGKADKTLLGLHKEYYDEYNRRIINNLMGKLVFPVFCYGFEAVPGGELVKAGDGGSPAVYRMKDLYRMAVKGTIKLWGNSMMFIGDRENVFYSMLAMVVELKENGSWPGNDMVTDMDSVAGEICKSGILNGGTEEKNRAGYDMDKGAGLAIRLGRQSVEKLRSAGTGLRPVCQIPFGLGGYRPLGFDEKSAPGVTIGGLTLKMHAVLFGLYGHAAGALIDLDAGIVTGSYDQIKLFLVDLKKTYVLSWRDRDYLDFFNERKTA